MINSGYGHLNMADMQANSLNTSSTESDTSSSDTRKLSCFTLLWKARFCFVTFFLTDLLQITMVTQYVLYRETNRNNDGTQVDSFFNNSLDKFKTACLSANMSTGDTVKWQRIERDASVMVTRLNALELLPAVPTVVFFSLWSDVTKRRTLLMWFPCLGNLIYSLALLVDYLNHLGNWFLYTGAVLSGLSGGSMLFLSGCASLLAHTATKEQLTLNISYIEMAASLSLSIGSITAGYMLQLTGFTAPLIYLVTISFVALLSNAFLVSDANPPQLYTWNAFKNQAKAICNICHCFIPWSRVLIVYFLNFQLYVFVHLGLERTNVLFLEMKPLCFSAELIGWWLFSEGILETIGTLVTVKVFFGYLGDSGLSFLGYAFRIASCICMAFSSTKFLIFLAVVFMSLQRLPLATIRASLSKITDLDKQGTVFGLLHSGEALAAFSGPFCFNLIFTTSVAMVPNPVYILASVITVLVAFLTCGSAYLNRKYQENLSREYHGLDEGHR